MRIEKDNVIFKTGRVRSANCGIIGLAPNYDVTGGYDQDFQNIKLDYWDDPDEQLTKEEMLELADYMIWEWRIFKDKVERCDT